MKELKLLIVEDDQDAIKAYQRAIKAFNIERKLSHNNDVQIIELPIDNKDSAINALRGFENDFDAAIVDLDLLGHGGQDSSGNDVIREIKSNLRFPVFVITGTPQHLEDDLKEQSSLFKLLTRGEEGDYLNEIFKIHQTGITQILNKKGIVENYISDIFWKHLSSSLNLWVDDTSRTPEEKEKSLLRYTLLHMLEYLDEDSIHPSEFYITEPVKQKLSTGDLITFSDQRWVVLTPACDFALRKGNKRNVNKAFLLRIKELSEELPNYDNTQKLEEVSGTLQGKIEKIIANNSKPYFHFIPKHSSIDAGLIDFQDKCSIPIVEIERKIEAKEILRIATISLPFLKDLIERYSSYYSRQGSPDFNKDEVLKSLFM
jgi:CheY-like chemotaxis protein